MFSRIWGSGPKRIFSRLFPEEETAGGGPAPSAGLYFIEGYFDAIRIAGYMDI
jgi:hypothetical protein